MIMVYIYTKESKIKQGICLKLTVVNYGDDKWIPSIAKGNL